MNAAVGPQAQVSCSAAARLLTACEVAAAAAQAVNAMRRLGPVSSDDGAAAALAAFGACSVGGESSSEMSDGSAVRDGGSVPSPNSCRPDALRGGVVMSNMLSLLCVGRGELGGVAM